MDVSAHADSTKSQHTFQLNHSTPDGSQEKFAAGDLTPVNVVPITASPYGRAHALCIWLIHLRSVVAESDNRWVKSPALIAANRLFKS